MAGNAPLVPGGSSLFSGQDLLDDLAVDIGQPEIPSLVEVRQLFMVKAKPVEDRGLEIVHVDLVPGNGKSERIRCAMGDPRFDSSPGHEHGIAIRVVISAQHLAS